MCEDQSFFNDINFDFLNYDTIKPTEELQMCVKTLDSNQYKSKRSKKVHKLSSRIAETNDLVVQLKQSNNECEKLRQQLDDLKKVAESVKQMYKDEHQKRIEFQNLATERQAECEKLDRDLANKNLQYDQLEAQCEEQKGPVPYNELVVKFLRIANKVEDGVLHWQDKSCIDELTRYCKDKNLRSTIKSPKKPTRKNPTKLEKGVQCDLSPAPQGRTVSQMLNEMINDWKVANPIRPIADPEPSAMVTEPVALITSVRAVGTCTDLCNVRRPIDYQTPTSDFIKRSNSRPPSRMKEDIKCESMLTPISQNGQNLPEEFARLLSQMGNVVHNVLQELNSISVKFNSITKEINFVYSQQDVSMKDIIQPKGVLFSPTYIKSMINEKQHFIESTIKMPSFEKEQLKQLQTEQENLYGTCMEIEQCLHNQFSLISCDANTIPEQKEPMSTILRVHNKMKKPKKSHKTKKFHDQICVQQTEQDQVSNSTHCGDEQPKIEMPRQIEIEHGEPTVDVQTCQTDCLLPESHEKAPKSPVAVEFCKPQESETPAHEIVEQASIPVEDIPSDKETIEIRSAPESITTEEDTVEKLNTALPNLTESSRNDGGQQEVDMEEDSVEKLNTGLPNLVENLQNVGEQQEFNMEEPNSIEAESKAPTDVILKAPNKSQQLLLLFGSDTESDDSDTELCDKPSEISALPKSEFETVNNDEIGAQKQEDHNTSTDWEGSNSLESAKYLNKIAKPEDATNVQVQPKDANIKMNENVQMGNEPSTEEKNVTKQCDLVENTQSSCSSLYDLEKSSSDLGLTIFSPSCLEKDLALSDSSSTGSSSSANSTSSASSTGGASGSSSSSGTSGSSSTGGDSASSSSSGSNNATSSSGACSTSGSSSPPTSPVLLDANANPVSQDATEDWDNNAVNCILKALRENTGLDIRPENPLANYHEQNESSCTSRQNNFDSNSLPEELSDDILEEELRVSSSSCSNSLSPSPNNVNSNSIPAKKSWEILQRDNNADSRSGELSDDPLEDDLKFNGCGDSSPSEMPFESSAIPATPKFNKEKSPNPCKGTELKPPDFDAGKSSCSIPLGTDPCTVLPIDATTSFYDFEEPGNTTDSDEPILKIDIPEDSANICIDVCSASGVAEKDDKIEAPSNDTESPNASAEQSAASVLDSNRAVELERESATEPLKAQETPATPASETMISKRKRKFIEAAVVVKRSPRLAKKYKANSLDLPENATVAAISSNRNDFEPDCELFGYRPLARNRRATNCDMDSNALEPTTKNTRSQTEGKPEESRMCTEQLECPASPSPADPADDEQVKVEPKVIPLELQTNKRLMDSKLPVLKRLIQSYKSENFKMRRLNQPNQEKSIVNQRLGTVIKNYLINAGSSVLVPEIEARNVVNQLNVIFETIRDGEQLIADAIVSEILSAPLELRPEGDTSIIPEPRSVSLGLITPVIQQLQRTRSSFTTTFMGSIEVVLFRDQTITMEKAVNLIHLYMIAIRDPTLSRLPANPARLLLAKCFYYHVHRTPVLVYEVLCQFPTVLPHREEQTYNRDDSIITVLQHLLMNHKYDMQRNDLRHKDLLSKLRFEYHFTPFTPQRSEVINNFVTNIRSGKLHNMPYAFALLCKRMEQLTVTLEVLKANLIPLAHEYYARLTETDEHDEQVACILECISMILRPFNLSTAMQEYISLFTQFLNVVDRQTVQEAAVQAIIRLQRFSVFNCYKALQNFRPTSSTPLKPQTKAMLKSFVYRKQLRFWRQAATSV